MSKTALHSSLHPPLLCSSGEEPASHRARHVVIGHVDTGHVDIGYVDNGHVDIGYAAFAGQRAVAEDAALKSPVRGSAPMPVAA